MGAGKLELISAGTQSRRAPPRNATNIVYSKPSKKKAQANVTASFKKAYNMLLPVKEIRVNNAETFPTDPGVGTTDNTKTYDLTNLAQATQSNQRLGNSIYGAYVHIRGMINNDSVSEGKAFRIILVREINKNDLDPATLANFYLTPTGALNQKPTGTSDDLKFKVNKNLYRVYFDKKYYMEAQGQKSCKLINEKIHVGQRWFYPYASGSNSPNGGRLILFTEACEVDGAPTTTPIVLMDMITTFYFKDNRKIWRNKNKV